MNSQTDLMTEKDLFLENQQLLKTKTGKNQTKSNVLSSQILKLLLGLNQQGKKLLECLLN